MSKKPPPEPPPIISPPLIPKNDTGFTSAVEVEPGYESLARVLDMALEQAQSGKGKERHASEGQAFEDQKIVALCEELGSNQGALFQVSKKALESARMDSDAAIRELLGAINYAAAAVIYLQRNGWKDDE